MGTSLPDLFASKLAAIQEKHADNAIGNVTGSNSVNVFLGLGLPWLLATIYHMANGTKFKVESGSLSFSVALYTIFAILCIITILLRRKLKIFGNAELGGNVPLKYVCGLFFVFMWFLYVLFSSLQAYEKIEGF